MPTEGMTRSHTVAEWISIQTGHGLVYRDPDGQLVKRNLSPTDAALEAQRVFAGLVFRDLSVPQTLEAAVLASARDGIRGSKFPRLPACAHRRSLRSDQHSDFEHGRFS